MSPSHRDEHIGELRADIEAVIRRHDPAWTGFNSGDPGITLVELMAWVATRLDPDRRFEFRVTWDGAYVSGISRVSGLGRIAQEVEYRDGGGPNIVRRIPGPITYEPITLERGITHDTAFEDWANQVRQWSAGAGSGAAPPAYLKNVRIEVLNGAGKPVIAYDVYRCWPSAYRPLPELETGKPPRLVEAITLVHDGWERDLAVVFPP